MPSSPDRATPGRSLHVRWLGSVAYSDALALQRAWHERSLDDRLVLLEHPHTYTLGSRATMEHVLVPPADVGAELVRADRGGDVTYHGPGQLVGYPIISLDEWRAGQRDVVAYVRRLERALIAALGVLGVEAQRDEGYPGVWVGADKIAAIGVRVARGRTRHGFALNVDPDLTMFQHIVPCGITDRGVTSLARLLDPVPTMRAVVDAVIDAFAGELGFSDIERQDVVWHRRPDDLSMFSRRASAGPSPTPVELSVKPSDDAPRSGGAASVRLLSRLEQAGVTGANATVTSSASAGPAGERAFRRPEWMRVRADLGAEYRRLKGLVRSHDLHTVCEEAGCPNIYECWADGTATFMILGERCTRACGFCLVDTRQPAPVDPDEPRRVARAVAELGLDHAVITCVARDDLPDGGAAAFAQTIRAIRAQSPRTAIEVLTSDCRGDPDALATIFAARPDVFNHNLETVARLQRAVRPSAGYARSLSVLARSADAGLVTKSGLIVGMGEHVDEVHAALLDLRAVGVDVVTVGQYLRPSAEHLPVARWWTPEEFDSLRDFGMSLGFAHVESGPLVRSSYHAKQGAAASSDDDRRRAAGE